MKRFAICFIAIYLLSGYGFAQSVAVNIAEPENIISSTPEKSIIFKYANVEEKAKVLLLKLNDIKTLDKSNMTPSELKKMRKEKRSLKHEFRENYRGHYSTAGSMIMTELMLIILF